MKTIYTLGAALLIAFSASAEIKIADGGTYRIACAYAPNGTIALGDRHDAVPYIYYVTDATVTPADGWWIISRGGDNGYTIRNAASGQYLVYREGRPQNAQGQYYAKGIQLSTSATDDSALWTITENEGGSVVIASAEQPGQKFNLRTDGSWLVGTYTDASTANGHFYVYDTDGKSIVSDSGGSGDTALSAYVDSIRLNGKDLIYDSKEHVYYASISQRWRDGGDFTGTLFVKPVTDDGSYTLRIGDNTVDGTGTITLPAISCNSDYELTVVKDGTDVGSATLRFTFLPIVEVSVSSCNSSYYTTGTLRVTDPEQAGYDETVIAAYRYRGASAQNYSKKSYAIKLRDENGKSVDREYFGLRDDNNWILDAMTIDKACMRNRVSTDLWNDFATPPYHRRAGWEKKAKTGTRGEFVEVFLNGTYHGLYCMTEKMDRKQLRLKKFVAATETSADTIHGTLFKSDQWNYEVLMGHESDARYFPHHAPRSYSNDARSETWANYEVKYPDWEKEKIDWGPLWNAINFVATSSDEVFDGSIDKWFDYPVLKDYYLFIELLLATDNHGKNMYFFNYDRLSPDNTEMIGIAPWDLDGTWGRRWDGSNDVTRAEQDFDTFLWKYEHGQHTIYYRLRQSGSWNWNDELKDRYAELRSTYFDTDALVKRFTDYASLFSESGADRREERQWRYYHSDIAADVNYIADWIKRRVAYLDEQYDYTPVPSGIDAPVASTSHVSATGGRGFINISATAPTSVCIYTAAGTLARRVEITRPATRVDGLTAGIYIVGNQKVLVR